MKSGFTKFSPSAMEKAARRLLPVFFAIVLGCGFSCPALAHDGPESEIEEITDRIKKEGESEDLLVQRAIEYRVLEKNAEAAKDLERALHFNPDSAMAQRELARTYFALGKTNEALDTASRGIKSAAEGAERASLRIVRAEILRERKEHQKALEDADKAINEHPGNVEWYLFRSQLHVALKQKKDRIEGLEEGVQATGSGVLEAEWVDALIENGEHKRALEKIEEELKDSRLQSSWLIRRAKVRLASGQKEEAKADLKAAMDELNARMTGRGPEAELRADRGMVHELLGNREDAKKDYEHARDKGVNEEWLRERLRVIRDAEEREKKAAEKKEKEKKEQAKEKEPPV
jgi:tetratricopeptide (TPR) repeat protein